MIRIVLVDDQTLVRQGIRALLGLVSDVSIVAEASDGDEAVGVIQREKPDVVLLDLRMPRKGGVEVLRDLQASSTLPPTIVLTTFDDDEALLDAVRAGAKGYFLKDVSLERLTDGIREVARGGSIIPRLPNVYSEAWSTCGGTSTRSVHPIRSRSARSRFFG
jgi:DNA-binding NarL/FixJ family response regulator